MSVTLCHIHQGSNYNETWVYGGSTSSDELYQVYHLVRLYLHRHKVQIIIICLAFSQLCWVGFQSNRMQLNTSVLHGATAYLTSTTQLLGNTIPLG